MGLIGLAWKTAIRSSKKRPAETTQAVEGEGGGRRKRVREGSRGFLGFRLKGGGF